MIPIRTESEEEYSRLNNKINEDFPIAPFSISLFDSIEDYENRIDAKFTDELTVLVKDDRSRSCSYYWADCTKDEQQQFITYTTVKGTIDRPISLRQIFNTMIDDPHYHQKIITQQDHNFLEQYEFISPCVLVFHYGS